MTGGWIQYLAVFLSSATFCLFLVPLAIRLSWRIGSLDHPGGHKRQSSPVPYLGGVAIVLAFSVATMVAPLIRPPNAGHRELNVILAIALILAAVGLLDDLKDLSPWVRILVEISCGIVVWNLGVGVSLTGLNLVDYALTIFWVVGITNAFNLLDNMDGLSGGVAAIAATMLAAVLLLNPEPSTHQPQMFVAGFLLVLVGSLIGFLWHNRPPARIFMGDAGSYFVGFCIATCTLLATFTSYRGSQSQPHAVLAPLCVLAVPIYDTVTVIWIRLRQGRSPFQADKNHFSHRLVELGFSSSQAVLTIYLMTACCGLAALLLHRVDGLGALLVTLLVVCVLAVIALIESTARRQLQQ